MIALDILFESQRLSRWPIILHENQLARGALSWSSQTADGFAANALGPQTYDYWTPAALPAWIQTTLPQAVECNSVAVVAHNLGSKGCTVIVEHQDGAAWVENMRHTPSDDSTILMLWNGAIAASWRIRVTGPSAPSIGVAMIGKRTTIRAGLLAGYTALPHARRVDLLGGDSMGGQFLGTRIKRQGAETTIDFGDVPRTLVDDQLAGFRQHFNAGLPFIWASDPRGDPLDAGYCWRSNGELRAVYGEDDWASLSFDIEAFAA